LESDISGQGDMDEDVRSRSPKTLADVSHLFFSKAEESAEEQTDQPGDEEGGRTDA